VSKSLYFVQECPTCGRNLEVRIEYLGKFVVCQHCQGRLVACDPNIHGPLIASPASDLLQRADQLLAEAQSRLPTVN
jgi:DNA-directed RNA polymerase subunit RPC12/RpoP